MVALLLVALASVPPAPPVVLRTLWVATAVVQCLDVHATLRAVDAGGREANRLMRGLVAHPPAFVLVKAAAATGVILATRHLAKTGHPKLAVGLLVLTTALYAVTVAHNYRVSAGRPARRR